MSLTDLIGLAGILIGLGLLIWLAFKGWSVLLLAPLAAIVAALFSREPLLAHWTQTFMRSAAGFLAQFFPLFLLGALFGKLMEDSGSVTAIADFMTQKLGEARHSRGRFGRSDRHLRRRQPLRRLLRDRAHGAGFVPLGRNSASADAGGDLGAPASDKLSEAIDHWYDSGLDDLIVKPAPCVRSIQR